jgi:thiol-disulfide isomerase/thioredoxin
MTFARLAIWLLVIVLVCVAVLLYGREMRAMTQIVMPDSSGNAAVGHALTDARVESLDGHKTSLRAFVGHPLWINFFATWCEPCKAETPALEREYVAQKAHGLIVVGIDEQESAAAVRSFVRRFGTTYPMVIDSGPAEAAYHAQIIPLSVFVDGSGTVRRIYIGQMQAARMDDAIALIVPKT